jgi:hypothetical protein
MIRPDCHYDDLPFIGGRDMLILRLAEEHDRLSKDPDVRLMSPVYLGGATWKDLLAGGLRALKSVGDEIARARTEADVAIATLRRDTYAEYMEETECVLLSIAIKKLGRGAEAEPLSGGYHGLIGIGRQALSGPRQIIPASHWEAGEVDWKKWQLAVNGGPIWTGIKLLDLRDLTPEQSARLLGRDLVNTEPSAVHNERGDGHNPNLSEAALHRFLSQWVAQFPSRSLSEDALWRAAQEMYPGHRVTRESVRTWMRTKMDPSKRLSRGERARR